MSWVVRHIVAVAVVLFAVAAMGAVFVFARPSYRPSSATTTVDMRGQRHYTVVQIKRAFAAHAIMLDAVSRGDAKHGLTVLGQPRRGKLASAFSVALFGTEGKVMFGPNYSHTYEARFGNVAVNYGYPHPDRAFLARIKAAVADLQR